MLEGFGGGKGERARRKKRIRQKDFYKGRKANQKYFDYCGIGHILDTE
jgi:hypothetical protein